LIRKNRKKKPSSAGLFSLMLLKQLLKPLHHFIRRAAGAVGGSGLGPFDEGYVTRSRAIFRAQ
jgi:hypothetical protein